MKCVNCGYKFVFEEDKCFFCANGNSKEFSILGHSIVKALGKTTPTNKRKTDEEKKQAAMKLYRVNAYDARRVYTSFIDGEFDEEAVTEYRGKDFEKIMEMLTTIRGATFKEEKPYTYSVGDCVQVKELLNNYKPSQLARAIVNGARDPFWKNKGISFAQLRQSINKFLLNKQPIQGDASKERRAFLMNKISKDIELLIVKNPIDGYEFKDVDRSMMDIGSLEIMSKKIEEQLK